jgi:uncharacterized protein
MKIEVEKIKKDQELKLSEAIPAESWELDSFDVRFVNSICLDCTFIRVSNEILVDAKVRTFRQITCSRCLTDATCELRQEFQLNYSVNSLGDFLEVDKDIREEILLNFPMKALCQENCRGICPDCKVNLNTKKCKCRI